MSETNQPRKGRAKAAHVGVGSQSAVRHGQWVAKELSTHPTQAAAVRAARTRAESKGGHVVVQGPDGRIREAYSIGRDPFVKISAVEGITPSNAALARAAEFERRGLTPEQRREAIIRAHRPPKG